MTDALKQLLALPLSTLPNERRIRQWIALLEKQFRLTEARRGEAFWEKPAQAPLLEAPIREQGLFTARDGTSIYYEVAGEGRPLLFSYGLVCRREHWHHQIRHFCSRYRVITFDYRGHHRSAFPTNDQNLTLQWLANDIADLAAHLKLTEIVCLGHSLGVPVLTHAGNMLRESIKGMIFICGSVMNPFERMFFSSRMNVVYELGSVLYDYAPDAMTRLWRKMTDRSRLGFILTSTFGFNPTLAEEQDVLRYLDGVNRAPLATFHSLLKDYSHFDGRDLLKTLNCPTLVIAGEDDCITPMDIQKEMATLIPKGQFLGIPEASHNAHMDLPAVVNGAIDKFLNELSYR